MYPTTTGSGCRQQKWVHRNVQFHAKATFFTQYLQKTPIYNCGQVIIIRTGGNEMHFGFDTRANLILLLNTGFAACWLWHLLFVVNVSGKLGNPKLQSTPSVRSQGLLKDQYLVTVVLADLWLYLGFVSWFLSLPRFLQSSGNTG